MSTLMEVGAANFAAEVLQSQVPVIVDFWAPWCGPCRALAPALMAAEQELRGKAKVVKVNVDEQPGLAVQLGVQAVPTLIVFKHGKAISRIVGVQSKDALVKHVLSV